MPGAGVCEIKPLAIETREGLGISGGNRGGQVLNGLFQKRSSRGVEDPPDSIRLLPLQLCLQIANDSILFAQLLLKCFEELDELGGIALAGLV